MQRSNFVPAIRYAWYYFAAHVVLLFKYDKKYITGRHFKGPHHNMVAPGWEWVVNSAAGCRRLRVNRKVKWPISPFIRISVCEKVEFDPDDLNNFQSYGIYFQTYGNIKIGKGTIIGPNTGFITADHDFDDYDKHKEPKDIVLGERCWIGMNSVVLSGVELGAHTIVGAGSVVTHSFPEGECVIAGSPARIIKRLNGSEEIKADE